jgi:hypothetical protein
VDLGILVTKLALTLSGLVDDIEMDRTVVFEEELSRPAREN